MKILIFGISGMLGHKVWQVTNTEFTNSVFGTIRKTKSELSQFDIFKSENIFENVDIQNTKQVLSILDNLKPDFIINCTGVTLRKSENKDIEKNMLINSLFPQVLALWAKNNQSRLIHFSTDCVFDGLTGNYTETDYPTASDAYGVSKFLGEVCSSNSLSLRVSIVGRELFGKTELIEWFLSQRNKTVNGYSQVYYTGLTTNFLAHEIVRIMKNYPTLSGLYQVSSEKISKYQLLVLLNKKFNNKAEIIEDNSKKSDKSLNCDKYIKATGFIKPNWVDMIDDLVKANLYYERE